MVKQSLMKLSSLFLFSFLFSSVTWGAACCGGGFGAPSIISGDDRAQVTSSLSFSEVVVDNVNSSGIWQKSDEHQKVESLKIEAAHIFSDRWQAGFSVPVMKRSKLGESYSGLGDVSTSVGYEYLTDWDYNSPWPKGIGYLQLTLPTGKSKTESEIGGLDSRGNGLWALGAGTVLTKILKRWDLISSFEIHRSFEKSFENSQLKGTLSPGYGGSLGLGAGYNTTNWRFGNLLAWNYEDAVDIRGDNNIRGSLERYATWTAMISYMAQNEWSGTVSYSDQTLFGAPVNTSLSRTVALVIQKRWLR